VALLWACARLTQGRPAVGPYLRVSSRIVLFAAGVLLSIYPRFLTEFLAFPVYIFRADVGSARFFVTDYLGWQSLLPAGVSFVCGVSAARAAWQSTVPFCENLWHSVALAGENRWRIAEEP
jgi:hypothetical protein